MNRSSSGLPLSKAMDGFLRFKVVEGLSDTTIVSYRAHLGCFLDHGHDIQLATIESHDIEDFFYWLRTDYVPSVSQAVPSRCPPKQSITSGFRSNHSLPGPIGKNSSIRTSVLPKTFCLL
jgi:hypothetical protein